MNQKVESNKTEQETKVLSHGKTKGLIEGHHGGNFTDYCNFCFNLGEQYLRQNMWRKRGYK